MAWFVMSRKKKRREFAQLRDKECEGMTMKEKEEWMRKMREQSKGFLKGVEYRGRTQTTNVGCTDYRPTYCNRYSLPRSNDPYSKSYIVVVTNRNSLVLFAS